MAEIITMPRLSDTMTIGTVAKWHKKIGDKVSEGDLLAEIETDKATMEFESFQEGHLLYIGVSEGKEAPVDSILAILGEKGEDIAALISSNGKSETKRDEPKAPIAETKETKTEVSTAQTSQDQGRVKASPLAKKIAEDKGVSLSQVQGSGEGGRIVKRDLENISAASPTPTSIRSQEDRVVSVTQMRKTIARRLAESKFSAPHFYLTMEIDMTEAVNQRKMMVEKHGVKFSFNDLIIKACALALRNHPAINSSWLGDSIRFNGYINIGVAVAVEDGLLVPVVRNADHKGVIQIGNEVRVLATKAKEKKLQPSEWEGNTFTISNLGMFGIDEFTAIINPPDACILAVGGISQKPIVANNEIVIGHIMKVTLSCDHRVVDGATGAQFLQEVKRYLETPLSMIL
jgi:pyruvate dehydrogenase E2 component (dihydrolipoamide acetyltransferase)